MLKAVLGVIVGLALEVFDCCFEIGPAMDERLETACELKTLEADGDARISSKHLREQVFEKRALDDDRVQGKHLLGIVVDLYVAYDDGPFLALCIFCGLA